jgi:pyruvate decarboxylase
MKQLLPKLAARLHPYQEGARKSDVPMFKNVVPTEDSYAITHAWFWPTLGAFFKEKDVIVAETGQFSCCLFAGICY